MTTKISKTTTTSWCPIHPTHCLPPSLGPNFNKISRKLPEHDVQRKILKARPHPEIFPITALRIPLYCPHGLWTSKPAFTPLRPGPLHPQAKYQRSIEKLVTNPTAIFAKLAIFICSTDENLGLSSETHPPRTTLYPPPREKAAHSCNPTAIKAHVRPCCEARGFGGGGRTRAGACEGRGDIPTSGR